MQLPINIFLEFFLFFLLALSFSLIYQTTKFFHIAHAIIITLGAYFSYFLLIQVDLPMIFALPLAVVLSILVIILVEYFIYRPLRQRQTPSWQLLIASLGVYVVLQNIISIVWGDDTKSIRTWEVKVGHEFFGAYITTVQIVTIVISLLLVLATIIFLQKNSLGKQIRAVASNPNLSVIFGISPDKVILWSIIIGSALASVAGILIALDTDMTPKMGFNILLYAVVAMIIGGMGSYWGLFGGALLLATAQHLSAYYIDSKWMNAIAFIILVAFLMWKPYGFSGKKLKKVEI